MDFPKEYFFTDDYLIIIKLSMNENLIEINMMIFSCKCFLKGLSDLLRGIFATTKII